MKREKAIFAGGCFWGVEHLMQDQEGVLKLTVGYTGGHRQNPVYEEVCAGITGHVEAIEIEYDAERINFETLAKLFFEIHDPTQGDGQGPDLGSQYLSTIFYFNREQRQIAEKLIKVLEEKGFKITTQLRKAETFWPAEDYHQNYYNKKGTLPYCHAYTKRFD